MNCSNLTNYNCKLKSFEMKSPHNIFLSHNLFDFTLRFLQRFNYYPTAALIIKLSVSDVDRHGTLFIVTRV